MKIYNKSNLIFTALAMMASFWLWLKGAPILCPIAGLVIWLAVQTTLNVHPTGDAADPGDRRREQEKSNQVRHMPLSSSLRGGSGNYSSAFLPTGDIALSNHKKLLPLSWATAAFTFLGTLTIYEDTLDYIGPINLAKYYSAFALMAALFLLDIYLAFRRDKNLFKRK